MYAGWIPSGGWTGLSTAGADGVNIPMLCDVAVAVDQKLGDNLYRRQM